MAILFHPVERRSSRLAQISCPGKFPQAKQTKNYKGKSKDRRKLINEALKTVSNELDFFERALLQNRHDPNKIYSLHEPEVS